MSARGKWGRELEGAVILGCRRYRNAGRADIDKLATPMRLLKGEWRFTEKVNSDFSGVISGGGSFRGECKECHQAAFGIFDKKAGLKDHQREALETAARMGAMSGLILAFLPAWEVYFIPIAKLVPFLDAPWRRSVTPDMARAWGSLLPIGVGESGKLFVKFLDGADHPDKANAITRMETERFANPLELPLEMSEHRKPKTRAPVDPFGADAFKRAKARSR